MIRNLPFRHSTHAWNLPEGPRSLCCNLFEYYANGAGSASDQLRKQRLSSVIVLSSIHQRFVFGKHRLPGSRSAVDAHFRGFERRRRGQMLGRRARKLAAFDLACGCTGTSCSKYDPCLDALAGVGHVNRVDEQVGILRQLSGHVHERDAAGFRIAAERHGSGSRPCGEPRSIAAATSPCSVVCR